MERNVLEAEALLRLARLDLHKNVIKDFNKGVLNYSERTPLGGILYWIDNNPEWAELVKKTENENDILFYHFTHEYTDFGELLSGLFVSNYPEEWEIDRDDLERGMPLAYVINLTNPELSEFGYVVISCKNGGMTRSY